MVAYFRSTGDMVWRRYSRNKRSTLPEVSGDDDHDDDDVTGVDDEEDDGILTRLTRNTEAR